MRGTSYLSSFGFVSTAISTRFRFSLKFYPSGPSCLRLLNSGSFGKCLRKPLIVELRLTQYWSGRSAPPSLTRLLSLRAKLILASKVAVLAAGVYQFSFIWSNSWVKLRSMNFQNYFECDPEYSTFVNAQARLLQLQKKSPILCSLLKITSENLSHTAGSLIPSAATGITSASTSAVSKSAETMFFANFTLKVSKLVLLRSLRLKYRLILAKSKEI